MTSLSKRITSSGRCPEMLLQAVDTTFDATVLPILKEESSIAMRVDATAANDFALLLQMAGGMLLMPPALSEEGKVSVIVRRRSVLLAICAATNKEAASINEIIKTGFLTNVKGWLDDSLTKSVGGIDFLIHMLKCIVGLPVTRSSVAESKLGRAVVAITNSKIFKDLDGNDNRIEFIKSEITSVKKTWSAVVQRENEPISNDQKLSVESEINKVIPTKREREPPQSPTTVTAEGQLAKKKKASAISDLIQKGTSSTTSMDTSQKQMSAAEAARLKGRDRLTKSQTALSQQPIQTVTKSSNSVKWPDKAEQAQPLEAIHEVETEYEAPAKSKGSRKERRKKDVDAEKDQIVKLTKYLEERQAKLDSMGISNSVEWKKPADLVLDQSLPQPTSQEVTNQTARTMTVVSAQYFSINDIPDKPTPLTEVELTLQMTSVATADPPLTFPFFALQETEATSTIPNSVTQPIVEPAIAAPPSFVPAPNPFVPPPPAGATPDLVRSLGLPPFLVGYNVQALQTLAASPGLMASFVDEQGRIDQVRLINMVNVLAQSSGPPQPPPHQPQIQFPPPSQPFGQTGIAPMNGGTYGQQVSGNYYQNAQQTTIPQSSTYGQGRGGAPPFTGNTFHPRSYRGENNGDGNLHLSGYGPTNEMEIKQLFSPFVVVDEVVMKGTFSFVNTSDAQGAQQAMQSLQGSFLGGRPIKISPATRRAPDPSRKYDKSPNQRFDSNSVPKVSLPQNITSDLDLDNVFDDRGNVATKNLFVAGYGPGTTEQYLNALFSQFGHVTGVVMKSTFSFVNTSDRLIAARAREALMGQNANGGNLRINFAKESGRLGTSFDSRGLVKNTNVGGTRSYSYYGHNG